jgi:hypothetical protein
MAAAFDASPNLHDWAQAVEMLWKDYGPTMSRVDEVSDALIYEQRFDNTSRVNAIYLALRVADGQPLAIALNTSGAYASLDALKRAGLWDDFLTMINSARPIPPDANNVRPWGPSATPMPIVTLAPAPTFTARPAPTALPVVSPLAVPTPNQRPVIQPGWQVFEQEVSRTVLGSSLTSRACDWTVLGHEGRKTYVWALCAGVHGRAAQGAPGITEVSLPAVLELSEDGATVTVQTPRDGTYYPEDVRALFPADLQQKIFDRTFDSALSQLEQHAKLRLKWPMLPPLGAADTAPANPDALVTQATVSIFSGRPDPAWMMSQHEIDQLDALVRGLTRGECPAPPDQLGYRGAQVQLGEGDAGRMVTANGLVWSGDLGASAGAICLRDPERSVEYLLLSSAETQIEDQGVKSLLAQLQQSLLAGWTRYEDQALGIKFTHPAQWEVGTKTEWSRVFHTKIDTPTDNPTEAPRFWFTVQPPGFKNEDFSAYNWWSDETLAAAWQTPPGANFTSPHAPDGYNTYTVLPGIHVSGIEASVFNNPLVWEAPAGTQERRVALRVGGANVMFGTYYKTEVDLQTFERVLASVEFDDVQLARIGQLLPPQPAQTPTPSGK